MHMMCIYMRFYITSHACLSLVFISIKYTHTHANVSTAQPGRMVDHVLGEFSRSERKQLEEVIMDALEAVDLWIEEDDTDKVMNKVNAPR